MARTCTVSGCSGAHVARGLCNMHYQAWKRANPTAPRQHATTIGKVKAALEKPATQKAIIELSGLNSAAVKHALAELRAAKQVHIGRWQAPKTRSQKFHPVYKLGEGEDATLTEKARYKQAIKTRRACYQRRKALLEIHYRARETVRAHGWAATLMMGLSQ